VMSRRRAGSVPPRKGMFSERSSCSMPASPRTKTLFFGAGRARMREM
jgi:hypothetical protein